MKKMFVLIALAMLFVGACSPSPEVVIETVVIEVTTKPTASTASTATTEPTTTSIPSSTPAFMPIEEYATWASGIAGRVGGYLDGVLAVNNDMPDNPASLSAIGWQIEWDMIHLEMLILAEDVEKANVVPPPSVVKAHESLLLSIEHYANAAQLLFGIDWAEDWPGGVIQPLESARLEIEMGNLKMNQAAEALP